jgi:hypothetical protein
MSNVRLLAIGYWLSAIGYRLLAIGYWLYFQRKCGAICTFFCVYQKFFVPLQPEMQPETFDI